MIAEDYILEVTAEPILASDKHRMVAVSQAKCTVLTIKVCSVTSWWHGHAKQAEGVLHQKI